MKGGKAMHGSFGGDREGSAMRALRGGGVLGVVLVLTIGALALAAPAHPASATAIDLRLTERLCGDAGSHCRMTGKPRFGETLVFSLVLDIRPDGGRFGRDMGECTLLNKADQAYYCDFVVLLPEGDVAVQGRLAYSFEETSFLPVTGGTGAYEGASGSWAQTGQDVDLHIVTP
jgi:hypothetical protein